MKILLLLLSGLSLAIANAKADNLLNNPSFEELGNSAETAADWNRWGDWINRETAWSPTSSGSCMIGYHHWQITNTENSGIWQDVSGVKAGDKVKFSVFVSADTPEPGASPVDNVELRLEATRNGKQVTIASVSTPISDVLGSSDWHELSVSGTTPENNLRVLIVVTPSSQNNRGGAVKIDDAKLEIVK